MNTTHLKYLLVVSKCHSINKAAQQLNLPHPYLSKIIAALEKSLGVQIFKRSHKGVSPTSAGEWVLAQAQEIIRLTDALETKYIAGDEQIYSDVREKIRLYTPLSQETLDALQTFRHQFPNVNLVISEKNMFLLPKQISEDTGYCAAIYSQVLNLPDFNHPLPDNLLFIPLAQEAIVALAAQSNPLASKYQTISLTTLAKQELVIFGTNENERDSFLSHILATKSPPNVRYTVTNYDMLYRLLKEQNYFTIGRSGHNDPSLREIPLRENLYFQTGLLFQKSFAQTFIGKAFVNSFLQYFKMERLP